MFLSLMVIVSLFIITGCSNKENYITDNEHLYDTAVQYIIDNDTNPEKNNDRYKMFVDYNGFGITEDENYRYVYMWIAEESYYIADNKIISGSGSSMPYKFTFELNDNKVIKIETPKDGNEYTSSIKEMYSDDIENKVNTNNINSIDNTNQKRLKLMIESKMLSEEDAMKKMEEFQQVSNNCILYYDSIKGKTFR